MCCHKGKVHLPLPDPPPPLSELWSDRHFCDHARPYNCAMQMASSTAQEAQAAAHGVNQYRIQGAVQHRLSALTPQLDRPPRFVQLYILDPAEATGRRQNYNDALIPQTLLELHAMVLTHHRFGRLLSTATDYIAECRRTHLPLPQIYCRISKAGDVRDRRGYEAPAGMGETEVAAFIPDQQPTEPHRMMAVRLAGGGLQLIPDTHADFFPLSFPLLFPFGTGGWHEHLLPAPGQRREVTLLQWASFHFHERRGCSNHFLMARRLLQEFAVVAYCATESQRLLFLRLNQATLRAEQYDEVAAAVQQGAPCLPTSPHSLSERESQLTPLPFSRPHTHFVLPLTPPLSSPPRPHTAGAVRGDQAGRPRIVLPSSFIGGQRYNMQLYQDAMAMVRKLGKPDLFDPRTTFSWRGGCCRSLPSSLTARPSRRGSCSSA